MFDRELLETLAVVVEVRSFERAARLLNVSKASVSMRIKTLEAQVSDVLLTRERPITPTQAGQVLLRHVQALRLLEHDVLQELRSDASSQGFTPVAVAVNADSLATWFLPAVQPLLASCRLALEAVVDDQDHTQVRLSHGEVIGCVSTQPRPALGFVSTRLGAMEYRCYATPDFAARYFADGFTLHAVLQAPAVLFNRKDSLHDSFLEQRFGLRPERYAKHFIPSTAGLLDAIAAGAGYGLAPALQAGQHRGELVELAKDEPFLMDLYWHRWATEPPLAQEITRAVLAGAAERLLP